MNTPRAASSDLGRCPRCGGRIAATHMLTKTYEVDAAGRWRRRLDDFAEDVVVVCAACGAEPEGTFDAPHLAVGDGEFIFIPKAG